MDKLIFLLPFFRILILTVAVMLGIILFILLLVLFVPISYRVSGYYESRDDYSINATAGWLFHFIYFTACWEDGLRTELKIAGISLKSKKEDSQDTYTEHNETDYGKTEQSGMPPAEVRDDTSFRRVDSWEKEHVNAGLSDCKEDDAESGKEFASDSAGEEFASDSAGEEKRHNGGFRSKLRSIKTRLDGFIKQRDKILGFIRTEEFKLSLNLLLGELLNILKMIKPVRFKAYVHYGLKDPCKTGELMGIYGMLSPFLGPRFTIYPEFDRECLDGKLDMRGRIFIFVLCIVLLRLYFNKALKKVIADYRQMKLPGV